MAPAARSQGVTVVIKQHGGNTATGRNCARIVDEVGDEGLRICYDGGNVMDYEHEDPIPDIQQCWPKVRAFCIKDHRFTPKNQDCGPGLGELDHYKLLMPVARTGLDMPLACENIFEPIVPRPVQPERCRRAGAARAGVSGNRDPGHSVRGRGRAKVNWMNRRYFLMGTLGASAVTRARAQSPAALGAGVIGTGNRGSADLQSVLAQPGVKVNALCDLKPDRLDKAASAAAAHKPATYKDYHELLARRDIDAVFIATPCDLHVEMAIAALKAGKHVYCEKPAGIKPESIQRLVEVARSSDRVFQIGQQMRSHGATAARDRKGP